MRILCFNGGSSSLKCSVEEADAAGGVSTVLSWSESGEPRAAAGQAFARVQHEQIDVDAVGHRFVFGGMDFVEPTTIDARVIAALRDLTDFAPLHMPRELALVDAVSELAPNLPQIACFDTAFHARIPERAWHFPLPEKLLSAKIRKFGFHGLSYEYLTSTNAALRTGRVIIAHLGNGASLAALHDGICRDTTMGLTPLGGLVMGTRTGDLDPGLLLYLLRSQKVAVAELDHVLSNESGLLGISGLSGDVRELVAKKSTVPAAALALEIFCYRLRMTIGAYAAALGGLDQIVFTGGIGEHSADIRRDTLYDLSYIGIELDEQANMQHAAIISTASSKITVHVIPTDENAMIALHSAKILSATRA